MHARHRSTVSTERVAPNPDATGSISDLHPPFWEHSRADTSPLVSLSRNLDCETIVYTNGLVEQDLRAGIKELKENWRGTHFDRKTLWEGVSESGVPVYVRTMGAPEKDFKEAVAYEFSTAMNVPGVPVTVGLKGMTSAFTDSLGKPLGTRQVDCTVQVAVPFATSAAEVFGFNWLREIPPGLGLLEVLLQEGDPNRDNHPVKPLAPDCLPPLKNYVHSPTDFPVQPGDMHRIDWEQAFHPQYEQCPLVGYFIDPSTVKKWIAQPDGADFMRTLAGKPSGWTTEILDKFPIHRTVRANWEAAVERGTRYLLEIWQGGRTAVP